jgi:uncharacterized protein (DUF1810 family)
MHSLNRRDHKPFNAFETFFFALIRFWNPYCIKPNKTPTPKRMTIPINLKRFIEAQEPAFLKALSEIRNGKKQTHWMWYIFPQLAGLGKSLTAVQYSIKNIREAQQYLEHPILGVRLLELSHALMKLKDLSAHDIFGSPDDIKLQSCMTLFSCIPGSDPVFEDVLEKYFEGKKDLQTIWLLGKELT